MKRYYAGLVPSYLYLLQQPSPADSSGVFIPHLMVVVNTSRMFYPQHIVFSVRLNPYIYTFRLGAYWQRMSGA